MPVMYEKMMVAPKMEPLDLSSTGLASLPPHHHPSVTHHNVQMISTHHVVQHAQNMAGQPMTQLGGGMHHHHHHNNHHSANSSPNPHQMNSMGHGENSPISMAHAQVIETSFFFVH